MAENETDLDAKIAEAITQPKSVEIDGERIERHSIPDQSTTISACSSASRNFSARRALA